MTYRPWYMPEDADAYPDGKTDWPEWLLPERPLPDVVESEREDHKIEKEADFS